MQPEHFRSVSGWKRFSENGNGVVARSATLNGVFGESETGLGLHGQSHQILRSENEIFLEG